MDRLRGVESLPVVCHRFSDGVQVVKCVLEFYREMASLERSYSASIHRLLKSSSYSFHSNILMQWLGSEPFEEIGTLKHCWQGLGTELCKLADLHSEMADGYQGLVRQPLLEIMQELEESRKKLKSKSHQIGIKAEAAKRRLAREKHKYSSLGDKLGKLLQPDSPKDDKVTVKCNNLSTELKQLEKNYKDAHSEFLDTHKSLDAEIQTVYQDVGEKEMVRVEKLKESLQKFTRTLSNTAPAYLEGMQRIVLQAELIDGQGDINSFVEAHRHLTEPTALPEFERHVTMTTIKENSSATSSSSSLTVKMSNCSLDDSDEENSTGDAKQEREREKEREKEVVKEERASTMATRSTDSGRLLSSKQLGEGSSAVSDPRTGRQRHTAPARSLRNTQQQTQQQQIHQQPNQPSSTTNQRHDLRLSPSSPSSSSSSTSPLPPSPATPPTTRGGGGRGMAGRETSVGQRSKPQPHPPPLPPSTTLKQQRVSSHSDKELLSASAAPKAIKHSNERGSSHNNAGHKQGGENVQSTRAHDRVLPTTTDGSLPVLPSLEELDRDPAKLRPLSPPMVSKQRPQMAPKPILTSSSSDSVSPPLAKIEPLGSGGGPKKPPIAAKNFDLSSRKQDSKMPPVVSQGRDYSPQRGQKDHQSPRNQQETLAVKVDDPQSSDLMRSLQEQASVNDYYKLIGVASDVSADELTRAWRQRSRELHPDHFMSRDPKEREMMQDRLTKVNLVYQDVLRNEITRRQYDQLCKFRMGYPVIVTQKEKGLEKAAAKLTDFHKEMKKAKMPVALLSEVHVAMELVERRKALLLAEAQ